MEPQILKHFPFWIINFPDWCPFFCFHTKKFGGKCHFSHFSPLRGSPGFASALILVVCPLLFDPPFGGSLPKVILWEFISWAWWTKIDPFLHKLKPKVHSSILHKREFTETIGFFFTAISVKPDPKLVVYHIHLRWQNCNSYQNVENENQNCSAYISDEPF